MRNHSQGNPNNLQQHEQSSFFSIFKGKAGQKRRLDAVSDLAPVAKQIAISEAQLASCEAFSDYSSKSPEAMTSPNKTENT